MADYATLLRDHVTLTCRSVDRVFLQGIFAKIPGLGAANKLLTRVLPLRRANVEERDGTVFVER